MDEGTGWKSPSELTRSRTEFLSGREDLRDPLCTPFRTGLGKLFATDSLVGDRPGLYCPRLLRAGCSGRAAVPDDAWEGVVPLAPPLPPHMPEVLDQSEVDALLAAVDGGEMGDFGEDGETQLFSRKRGRDGRPQDEVEVRHYDFKRPERVSKDQMRALETLHESFARNFGAALSGFLRTIMEVRVANIEQMTFSEFTHSLPNPTCFNLIRADPLEGNMCLEISPLIIYPVIDRLLGGSNADLFIPQRPLTAIEQRLVGKILDRSMTALREAWANVLELEFHLHESESNPALVQIVPPNEVVVVVGFELKMGGRAGTMSLGIPYNLIEPVVDKLSNQSWAAYKKNKQDSGLRHRLTGHLEGAKLTVVAELATTTMKLSELLTLSEGDVITTDKPVSSPLPLTVQGRRKYIGHVGQHKGSRAFRVDRAIGPRDRV